MSLTAYITSSKIHVPHLSSSKHSTLPGAQCELTYLNEGGANFVFRLAITSSDEANHFFGGQLLRVRKEAPHAQSTLNQYADFNDIFATLFPSANLVQNKRIILEEGLRSALSAYLEQLDRPPNRLQDRIADNEELVLLVTDMTAKEGEVLVQLKPKWLAQSPNAPSDAKRCRTCALRARRASKKIRTATDAQGSCPLDLLSENEQARRRFAEGITDDETVREFMVNGGAMPLLQSLRRYQGQFDAKGVLEVEDVEGLCKAMTLRDCTLYLRRSRDGAEARLGDLDLKRPQKVGKWRVIEEELIGEGWYGNKEGEGVWSREVICALSR